MCKYTCLCLCGYVYIYIQICLYTFPVYLMRSYALVSKYMFVNTWLCCCVNLYMSVYEYMCENVCEQVGRLLQYLCKFICYVFIRICFRLVSLFIWRQTRHLWHIKVSLNYNVLTISFKLWYVSHFIQLVTCFSNVIDHLRINISPMAFSLSLLVLQNVPVYLKTHWQVKKFKPCIQVPLFKHWTLAQLSIIKSLSDISLHHMQS